MTNLSKVIGGIAVVAFLIGALALSRTFPAQITGEPSFGGLGVKNAEQYDPYIKYNGGYLSALPIKTTSTFEADGAITLAGAVSFTSTSQFSSTGTNVNRVNFGTCNIQSGPGITSLAVFAQKSLDCSGGAAGASSTALTGVTAGDQCFVDFATTTVAGDAQFRITGVNASSTQGYITLNLYNASSSAYTLASTATSSLAYMCIH